MTTQNWSKRETQRVIRALRGAGFTVDKISPGGCVICQTEERDWFARPIFKALLGRGGYLITHHSDLFERDARCDARCPAHRFSAELVGRFHND